jgi:hypothetical protein
VIADVIEVHEPGFWPSEWPIEPAGKVILKFKKRKQLSMKRKLKFRKHGGAMTKRKKLKFKKHGPVVKKTKWKKFKKVDSVVEPRG